MSVRSIPQVGVFAGTDLAAKLTNGWLPVGKYTPLSEASMRQQGYEVQILPLTSTASVVGAQLVYPYLPAPNSTAFQLVVNVRPTSSRDVMFTTNRRYSSLRGPCSGWDGCEAAPSACAGNNACCNRSVPWVISYCSASWLVTNSDVVSGLGIRSDTITTLSFDSGMEPIDLILCCTDDGPRRGAVQSRKADSAAFGDGAQLPAAVTRIRSRPDARSGGCRRCRRTDSPGHGNHGVKWWGAGVC